MLNWISFGKNLYQEDWEESDRGSLENGKIRKMRKAGINLDIVGRRGEWVDLLKINNFSRKHFSPSLILLSINYFK